MAGGQIIVFVTMFDCQLTLQIKITSTNTIQWLNHRGDVHDSDHYWKRLICRRPKGLPMARE
jgi:hypothetical protein